MTKQENAPQLVDGVVTLDRHGLADVEQHLAGEDDEQARRFGWYPDRSTNESVRAAIESWQDQWRNDGPIRAFAIRSADSGDLVGGCEIRLQGDSIAHISYWVFPLFRRLGYATRADRLACSYAFAHLGVDRIELYSEDNNIASSGVARRVGFIKEGVLRNQGRFGDERHDMVLYSLLPNDLTTIAQPEL
ncbi:MAG: GNAT family protein [Acidimicrobiia bacterium]